MLCYSYLVYGLFSILFFVTYGNQVFDHIHVWKRVDFRCFICVGVDFVQTCQGVASVYVHGT